MSFGQIISYSLKIPNFKSECVQQIITLSNFKILISFETSLEIWNTIPLFMIKRINLDEDIFYWMDLKPIDESTISFIKTTKLELWTLNLLTLQQKFIFNIPKDSNIIQNLVFKESQNLVVVYKGLTVTAVMACKQDGLHKTWNFKWDSSVEKYDNINTLAVFLPSRTNQSIEFQLVNQSTQNRYLFQGGQQQKIDTIIKHSEKTCLVGCYNLKSGEFKSYIYHLQQLQVIRQIRQSMFIQKILKTKNQFIGFGLKKLSDAKFQLSAINIEKENKNVISFQIPNLDLSWGEQQIMILTDSESSVDSVDLTIVRWISKQKMYINLLQKTQMIKEFGVQIVQSTLFNLTE